MENNEQNLIDLKKANEIKYILINSTNIEHIKRITHALKHNLHVIK